MKVCEAIDRQGNPYPHPLPNHRRYARHLGRWMGIVFMVLTVIGIRWGLAPW